MTAHALPFLGRRTGTAVPRGTAWVVLGIAAGLMASLRLARTPPLALFGR